MEKQPPRPSSKPLKFSPITEGLGFHPFSDGLPYAPLGKSGKPAANVNRPLPALGAVSAGPPTPVIPAIPVRPAPRVSVPVAPAAKASPRPVMPVQPASAAAAPAPMDEPVYGLTYPIKRVLAYGIDTALNTSLCVAALSVALARQDLSPDSLFSPGVVVLFVLFLAVFNWALIAAQEVAFGTTVGKRIFGLSLAGNASAIFLRAFFFLPSVGFCGIGLLWALFNRRKRCWHDSAVDLQPLEVARL
jgi:uncharacterized RDD family membrane protein YckC